VATFDRLCSPRKSQPMATPKAAAKPAAVAVLCRHCGERGHFSLTCPAKEGGSAQRTVAGGAVDQGSPKAEAKGKGKAKPLSPRLLQLSACRPPPSPPTEEQVAAKMDGIMHAREIFIARKTKKQQRQKEVAHI
jgi:hypothetical protein